METLNIIVYALQLIALCVQYAFIGIIIYGTMHEGAVSEEDMKKYDRNQWLCCAFIFAICLIYLF